MKKILVSCLIGGLISTGAFAQERATSAAELSEMVRTGSISDSRETRSRIAAFEKQKAQQASLLASAKAERKSEEARSDQLKLQYDENDLLIAEKTKQLDERLGSLKELFGHMAGFVGDTRENIDASIVSAQYPGRTDFMEELGAKLAN